MTTVVDTPITPARKLLVDMIADVNHGRIEGLHVRRGEPLFEPRPTVVCSRLYDKRGRQNRDGATGDAAFNDRIAWLFGEIGLRSLEIRELVICDGLPVRFELVEARYS